jgi:hypothetical protein
MFKLHHPNLCMQIYYTWGWNSQMGSNLKTDDNEIHHTHYVSLKDKPHVPAIKHFVTYSRQCFIWWNAINISSSLFRIMAAVPCLRQPSMASHHGGSGQSQASLSEICGEQSGTGTYCSKNTQVFSSGSSHQCSRLIHSSTTNAASIVSITE